MIPNLDNVVYKKDNNRQFWRVQANLEFTFSFFLEYLFICLVLG